MIICSISLLKVSAQEFSAASDSINNESKDYNSVCEETSTDCETEQNQTYLQRELHYGFAFQRLNEWKVGPNPTSGSIQIFGNQEDIETIEVFTITGEMLLILDKSNFSESIDLSFYPNGIYFVRIVSDFNVVKTYKIVKR